MELIIQNDIVALEMSVLEAIRLGHIDEQNYEFHNIITCNCSVCDEELTPLDTCYYCGDNDELMCQNCYDDYVDYNNADRVLGTQIRKLNKYLEKHKFHKFINAEINKMEDV